MEKVKKMDAIKRFFEQKDAITPEGGRQITTAELLEFVRTDREGFRKLAELCAARLGVELDLS